MHRALVAGLLLALSTSPFAAQAGPTVTEDYVAGFAGDVDAQCAEDEPHGLNIGGACFEVPNNKESVQITVDDVAVAQAGGWWWAQYDKDGTCLSLDPDLPTCNLTFGGCGPRTLAIDPRAKRILIALDGFAYGPLDCAPDAGFTTAGTVTATFN